MAGTIDRKVAVTGATGMIGSNLAAELAKAGYTEIILLVRNINRIANIERTFALHGLHMTDFPINTVETELTDTCALAKSLQGIETVFNCAAVIMTGELTPQQLIDNNVAVARSVVDASLRAGVKKIIHISSIAVLDTSEGLTKPVNEECIWKVTEEDSAYSQSKYNSDLEIARGEEAGLETVRVLPAVVIGEGDWSMRGSSAMIPVICHGLPFYTDGIMGYVDVRDVARAMAMLENIPGASGESFILSARNLLYRELITLGAEAAGKRKPFIRAGKPLVMFIYGIVKGMGSLRLIKNRSIKRSNLDSVLFGNLYDGSKIEKFCNFAYSPIEDTVGRAVKNYLSERKFKR